MSGFTRKATCVVCKAPASATNKKARCLSCQAAGEMTPCVRAMKVRQVGKKGTAFSAPLIGRTESPYEVACRYWMRRSKLGRGTWESTVNHPIGRRVDRLARRLAHIPGRQNRHWGMGQKQSGRPH